MINVQTSAMLRRITLMSFDMAAVRFELCAGLTRG